MSRLGRLASYSLPFITTVATLLCVILIIISGLNPRSPLTRSLYFLKADTSHFANATTNEVIHTHDGASISLGWADHALVTLWNFCLVHKSPESEKTEIKCSSPSVHFTFNPIDTWKLPTQTDGISPAIAKSIKHNAVHSTATIACYFIALVSSLMELLVGAVAVRSERWAMSIAATVIATTTSLALLVASVIASSAYPRLLKSTLETSFENLIKFHLGTHVLAVTWVATFFSNISAAFWFWTAVYNFVCGWRDRKSRAKAAEMERAQKMHPYMYTATPRSMIEADDFDEGYQKAHVSLPRSETASMTGLLNESHRGGDTAYSSYHRQSRASDYSFEPYRSRDSVG